MPPGAVMLMLVPDGGVPAGGRPTPWNDLLPDPSVRRAIGTVMIRTGLTVSIEKNLAEVGLRLHSWWDFDVPVYIPDPRELYIGLSWIYMEDEVPSYQEVAPLFERIFKEFAGPQGLEIRWRRSIWKAVIPA